MDDETGKIIDEILDKRERHSFKSLCWINGEEMVVTTKNNYIFKVNFIFSYYLIDLNKNFNLQYFSIV